MRLTRPGTCRLCGERLRPTGEAIVDDVTQLLRCVDCEGVARLSTVARHRDYAVPPAHPDGVADLRSMLDDLWPRDVRALHGRRIPGSQRFIDHVVVTPGGVWVVGAQHDGGRPRLVAEGGVLRPRAERLAVGRRDGTRMVGGVLRRAALVRDVVGPDVSVHPALCFVGADWPAVGGDLMVGDVAVVRPRRLAALLTARPTGTPVDVADVRARLGVVLRVS